MDKNEIKQELNKRYEKIDNLIKEKHQFLEEKGDGLNQTSKNDPAGNDPFEMQSFTRGKLTILYSERNFLKNLSNKI